MKFQASELPIGKPHQARKKTSKLAPLIALTILLTIPLYYPTLRDSSLKKLSSTYDQPIKKSDTSPVYDQSLDEPIKKLSTTSPVHDESLDKPIKKLSFTSPVDDESLDEPIKKLSTTLPVHDESLDEPIKKVSTTSPVHDEPLDEPIKATAPLETTHLEKNTPMSTCSSTVGCEDGDVAIDHLRDDHHGTPEARKKHARPNRRKRAPAHKEDNKHREEENTQTRTSSNNRESIRSRLLDGDQCDLFSGEWVPNPEGPYYTNESCNAIQEHQNCLKFGRPDREFLKWRWKPDDCELPVFDPARFLEIVSGKSIAFVGDSVARNHMQSLICLLSRVATPEDLSDPADQNKRYEYPDHDFNISMFWAPYLVRTEKTDPNDEKRPFKLFLDEFDPHWTSNISPFDYLIISAGHWFFRPTYFYLRRRLVGCLYCPETNVTRHTTAYFSYRRAFRTALTAAGDFGGVTFLRTFAPSHFEGAAWDRGGDCRRQRPYGRREAALEGYSLEMYLIQLEELRIARKAGRRRFRLFDATRAMLLRPDGHPSKYGHWQVANQTNANDCVHWCLPGPIDSWNDFLQELLRRERER